jgi:hypothetical protein
VLAYVLVFVGLWFGFDRYGDFQVIALAAAIGDAFFVPFVLAMVFMYMHTARVLAGELPGSLSAEKDGPDPTAQKGLPA